MGPTATFEERVSGVVALGFTDRRARFLVTVALHSGFCMRRQYEAFAQIGYGKNVIDFLEGVVKRGFASRQQFCANRGFIYHLHARRLYRALGDENNRNRRRASYAQVARKVMLLDYVISRRDLTWYATEREKVELFTRTFGIDRGILPGQLFTSERGGEVTARYFLDKLPIGVDAAGTPLFVYLSPDGHAQAFRTFLQDYARLFNGLTQWRVAIVGPQRWANLESVFRRFRPKHPLADIGVKQLKWYFKLRALIEANDLRGVPVRDLQRFRELRKQLQSPTVEALYARWTSEGELSLDRQPNLSRPDVSELIIERLPFSYDQFGTWPGVA